jgi:hypothetical protein
MPTVQRYGQAQTQAEVNPNIRVTEKQDVEAFGGGQGLSRLTSAAVGLAENVKERADSLAVMEVEKEMNDFETQLMYSQGEDDGQGGKKGVGLAFKKGKDAFETPKLAREEFNKKRDEILNRLSNPNQKAMFSQKALQREAQLNRQVSRHVANEIEKYEQDTFTSYMKSEREKAVVNYQDPEAVAQSLYNQETKIKEFADRNGLPPETLKYQLESARSQTHSDVISRMIANGDDLGAEAYFAKVKPDITGGNIEQVEKELEIGSLRGASQRSVDQFMRSGMSEAQAYSQAAKIESPKLREATEARIAKAYGQREAAENQRQQDIVEYAAKVFDKTGDYPPELTKAITSLKPQYKEMLDKYRERNPMRDDGVLYYKLQQMAANPETRQKFANHDLLQEMPNLSKDHFEKLRTYQKNIKEGKDSAGKELDGIYSDAQVVENVYKEAGFDTKDVEDYSKFKNRLDEVVLEAKKKKGGNLTNSEIRDLAKQQTLEVVTSKGFLWDTKKPRFLIDQETIPESDRLQIIEVLNKKGKPATEKNILDLFIMKANANER